MTISSSFYRTLYPTLYAIGVAVVMTAPGCGEGRKVTAGLGVPCVDDGECLGTLHCLVDFPGGYCSADCAEQADCDLGICTQGNCLLGCDSDAQCRDGYSCVHSDEQRVCAPPARGYHGLGDICEAQPDCADDLECLVVGDGGSQCTRTCTSVLNCGSGAECIFGLCRRTCERDSDCQGDQVCASTPEGRICTPAMPSSGLGGPCIGNGDCDAGLTCLTDAPGGYCTRECGGAGDCPEGVCHGGFCFASCSPSADEVDLLFVIDDSAGRGALQQAMIGAMPDLVAALEGAGTDYRIGVVSTDVTTAPHEVVNCRNLGGVLQNTAQGACEAPVSEPWITATNVVDPAASFACIAALGDGGCGFEQPLEAVQRALSDAVNPGFIRAGAHLMILLLTTEDDCSAQEPDLFDANAAQFGDFTSFRCFDHGITCDGPGPNYTNCHTKDVADGGVLYPIARYVSQLEGLKGDLSNVTVVAIAGPEMPVQTGLDEHNQTAVLSSCMGGGTEAQPGIRLRAFLDAVYGHFFSICTVSYTDAWQPLVDQVTGGGCRAGYQCNDVTEGPICEPSS